MSDHMHDDNNQDATKAVERELRKTMRSRDWWQVGALLVGLLAVCSTGLFLRAHLLLSEATKPKDWTITWHDEEMMATSGKINMPSWTPVGELEYPGSVTIRIYRHVRHGEVWIQ